jgi:hypothetical protein
MRISHRHRFVFFANPKTGSSSVRRFLDPLSDVRPVRNYLERTAENPFYPHMPPAEARVWFRRFGWDFNGYTKFVFVRNPWERVVSLYEHVRRSGAAVPPFDEWVYTVRPYGLGDGAPWERWRRYGSYSLEHFVKDESGGILVDKVIRLEDIADAFVPFLMKLGLPIDPRKRIPHRNRRPDERPYTAYYDAESVAHIRDLYRYDIVHYGYEFGTPAA